jgi:hypothetical protein
MKKLINICGTARSGSTMVDLIIGNDPKGFSLGEVYAWFRPFRSHHFKIICSCEGYNCPWDQLMKLKESEFHKECFEILDVNILVDSSKDLPWVIDSNITAGNIGISVYNILLYKDPVSFFYSFWKRGVSINKARRNEFLKYYKRFFESNLPFIAVNYDKLVSDPAAALENLCQKLGIPYFEGKERFWEKAHHHLFGSRGTRKQVEKSKSIIREKEDYPQEFKNIIPKIEADNRHDKEFLSIFEKLEAHELWNNNLSTAAIRKPYWYYLAKLKQKFKQRFPVEWKYNQ